MRKVERLVNGKNVCCGILGLCGEGLELFPWLSTADKEDWGKCIGVSKC